MLAPLVVCFFMMSNSSGVKRAGLFQHAIVDTDFADVVKQGGDAQLVQIFGREAQFLGDQRGIFGDAAGVTAGVRILFVDGGGEHADGADEQFAIFFGGFLEALDVLFDVAGHLVEVFGEFADFGGAAHRSTLMEFTAADGAGGGGQAANRAADADGEEVSKEDGDEHDDGNEGERLGVEFVDASIVASFFEAALGDDGPVHFGEGAVGADHLDVAILFFFGEAHRFGVAQFLGQSFDLRDDVRLVAEIFAGHEGPGVGMRDDVAEVIDDEDGASAHAGILQAVQNGIERNDSGEHAGEIVVHIFQRNGDDKGGAIVWRQCQGIAAEIHGLRAADKGALQGFGDEGILFGAEISLRGAGAFAGAADGGEIDEGVAIRLDEIFEQAGDFRLAHGIVHVVDAGR